MTIEKIRPSKLLQEIFFQLSSVKFAEDNMELIKTVNRETNGKCTMRELVEALAKLVSIDCEQLGQSPGSMTLHDMKRNEPFHQLGGAISVFPSFMLV